MAKFCNHCSYYGWDYDLGLVCEYFTPPKKLEFSYNNDLECPLEK